MNRIIVLFKQFSKIVRCKMNPIKYANKLGVKIGDGTRFYGMKPDMFSSEPWLVSIGKRCHITSDVLFITHDAGTLIIQDEVPGYVRTGYVTVGDDTVIGIRSIVLAGTRIGSRCIIGGGSVVSRDIPDNSIAAGVPCKVICSIDEYIEKVKKARDGEDARYFADLDYMHSLNPRLK